MRGLSLVIPGDAPAIYHAQLHIWGLVLTHQPEMTAVPYAMLWMMPPSTRSDAPLVAEASFELT
jgi:hypothetical protein